MVTMLSTFVVLFVIIGALNVANIVSVNTRADDLLKILVDNGGTFPEFFMGRQVEFENNVQVSEDAEIFDNQNTSEEINKPEDGNPEEWPDAGMPPDWTENGTPRENFNPSEDGGHPEKPKNNRIINNRREQTFTYETPYETRFFSVMYYQYSEEPYSAYLGRIAAVSEDEAIQYTKTVLSRMQHYAKFRGYYKDFRYRIKVNDEGSRLVVFVDMSRERKNVKNVLVYSLVLSAVGLLAVFVLVWYFSKKVFKPVEESDRRQKQFITDASHELKTPLTIISANVEVLEMESEESSWSKSIKHQVERMNGLVGQMVTLSRLDENRVPEFKEFNYSDAVYDTAQAYLAVAEKNGQKLTIETEDGIVINGDEALIRQMTGLLLDNATKYAGAPKNDNPINSVARIKITLQKKGKKTLLTVWNTVTETEIGNKDRYFERFYRPDESRNSNVGGSGIGLAIVKSIAETHKGSVSAKSTDTESIQFEIII